MLFNLLSEASNTPSGGGNYTMCILLGVLVVILGVMMFTSSRANKKRQKEAEEKLNGLRVGDRVKTIVVEIDNDENTFVLETGMENSGNFIKFDKVAVYQSSHPEDVSVAEPAEPAEVSAEENAEAAEAAEDVSETVETAENTEE